MRTINLEQTCELCPEQYWAHSGAKTIGYIRLRWGHLTCDYLPTGRAMLSNNDIRVLDYQFEDEYKGCFDTDEERKEWLKKCKDALMKEFLKNKHK
jgi:hypothetical protein